MKYILIIISFISIHFKANAQHGIRVLKGNVTDAANNEPISDVTITIFKASDTSLVNFGFTTPNGNYELTTKIKDSLFLVVSILGYKEHWIKLAPFDGEYWMTRPEKIKLSKASMSLNEVEIRGSAIRMRGDTIEISASRFKVMPGSDVSQLFSKIPGFNIDIKGNLTVDGSKVSKIMVDGSDFFGNNPGLVSKNLKADMVQTVQVYDDKDEDGVPIQDGTKTINLKLKKGKKNGMFGDVLIGYGTDNKYEAGLRLNSFKNDRKLSFIANSNNINSSGFDFGFNNWHGNNYFSRNGSGNDDFYYFEDYNDEEGNINTKSNIAISYFNEFKKKRKLSFELGVNNNVHQSYNYSDNLNIFSDSLYQKSIQSINTKGHIIQYFGNIDFSRKIDSTKEISTGIDIGQMDQTTLNNNTNYIFQNVDLINNSFKNAEYNKSGFGAEVYYKFSQRFKKSRHFRWNLDLKTVLSNNTWQDYVFNMQKFDTLNIKRYNNNLMNENFAKASIKIPIYKEKIFYHGATDFYSKSNLNLQNTFNALNIFENNKNQPYANKIDTLSLELDNLSKQISVGSGLSFQNKIMRISAGATYINFQINNNNLSQSQILNKNYERVLPYFSWGFWKKKSGYMHFSVSKNVEFPKIENLMPVQNISNPMMLLIGNTNLRAEDNYRANLFYQIRKGKWFDLIYLNFSYKSILNKITNSRQISEQGITYQLAENLGLANNFSYNVNYEKIIKKIFTFGINYSYYYNNNPVKINQISGNQTSLNHTISPNVSITLSDKFDLDLSYSITFLKGKNSINEFLTFNQSTQKISGNLRSQILKNTNLSLATDIMDQRNIPGIGKIVPLLHFYVQQGLDKNGIYNLKLTCYDILKQNTGIARYNSDGGVIISSYNQLQRYFMFTLIRKLNKSTNEEKEGIPTY